jgi:phospholipid-translocating ATPase
VPLALGYIVTYVAPLAFVLLVTMAKEAFDDYQRWVRDREANSTRYLILDSGASAASHNGANGESGAGSSTVGPTRAVPSSALKVGDLVLLEKDQRVPADLVLLRTSDEAGGCFVRTDQLDGETDWKLRLAVPAFQPLTNDDLLAVEGEVYGEPSSFAAPASACTELTGSSPLYPLLVRQPIRRSRTSTPLSAPSPIGRSPALARARPECRARSASPRRTR